jgi:hypothetical protein
MAVLFALIAKAIGFDGFNHTTKDAPHTLVYFTPFSKAANVYFVFAGQLISSPYNIIGLGSILDPFDKIANNTLPLLGIRDKPYIEHTLIAFIVFV